MSFDIQHIIYESDQSHTKKSKENNIGFLSRDQRIFDESVVL
jgi:hypothetical protein